MLPTQTGGDVAGVVARALAATTSLEPGPFARLDAGPAGWVAYTSVLRARRAPVKLLYVAYPLFTLRGPVGEAFATGTLLLPGAALSLGIVGALGYTGYRVAAAHFENYAVCVTSSAAAFSRS